MHKTPLLIIRLCFNFRDIKPQSHFRMFTWRQIGRRKKLYALRSMGKGANAKLFLARGQQQIIIAYEILKSWDFERF